MFKIEGLDTLSQNLRQAQQALAALDGDLGSVKFTPDDPASIDAAIREVERLVDEKLGAFSSNPIIGPLAAQMKEQYRQAIIDKAAAARSAEE